MKLGKVKGKIFRVVYLTENLVMKAYLGVEV